MTSDSQRTLLVSIAFLVSVQLVTSISAVVLHARMAPAIERIVEENVQSVQAVEEMALALATADAGAEARFHEALRRARDNVTEPTEQAPLGVLERDTSAAFAADPQARARVLSALATLGAINREAMDRQDQEAKRLGVAGAWASVLLALLGMVSGVLVLRQMDRSLLRPIIELGRVADAVRRGESHRRCHLAAGSAEVERAMSVLNELLDERDRSRERSAQPRSRDPELLRALLDAEPAPVAIVDSTGAILVASRSAMEALAGERGDELAHALRVAPKQQDASPVTARGIGAGLFRCDLGPSPGSASPTA